MWYAVTMKMHVTEVEIKSVTFYKTDGHPVDAIGTLPMTIQTKVEVSCKNGYYVEGVLRRGKVTMFQGYTLVELVLDAYEGEVTIEGRYYGKV